MTMDIKKDPVCGMDVENDNISYEYQGKNYWFCNQDDLNKFKQEPDKYIQAAA